ncbi:MAG: hypothetical protein ACLQDF_07430 [Desulfomonilia bacterium]
MGKFLRFVILFVACLTLSLIAEISCYAAAKIQVDQTVYDAGSIPEGKDLSHEFIFKNVGDQKLTFKPKPC